MSCSLSPSLSLQVTRAVAVPFLMGNLGEVAIQAS